LFERTEPEKEDKLTMLKMETEKTKTVREIINFSQNFSRHGTKGGISSSRKEKLKFSNKGTFLEYF